MQVSLGARFSSKNGSVLALVLMTLMVASFAFVYIFSSRLSRKELESKLWNREIAYEGAEAAIAIMEAALERRMWEFPPVISGPANEICLKSLETSSIDQLPGKNDVDYKVTAKLYPADKLITISAEAKYHGVIAKRQRDYRLDDAGGVLILNRSKKISQISRSVFQYGWAPPPASILGRDRRVEFAGPVVMSPNGLRLNALGWSGASPDYPYPADPANYGIGAATYLNEPTFQLFHPLGSTPYWVNMPNEIGVLVQAERMNFLGGIGYQGSTFMIRPALPLTLPWDLRNGVHKLDVSYGCNPVTSDCPALIPLFERRAQVPGMAIFTDDYTKASQILAGITPRTCAGAPCLRTLGNSHVLRDSSPARSSDPSNEATVLDQKLVYPKVLFGESWTQDAPMISEGQSDTGNYLADPKKWMFFNFFGQVGDISCTSPYTASEVNNCSFSGRFPEGFKAWRNAAGLTTSLKSTDGNASVTPTISWDNFESLKEDAAVCGAVIENSASRLFKDEYEDCDMTNQLFLSRMSLNEGQLGDNLCYQVIRMDFDKLATGNTGLANFTPSIYANDTLKDRFLRRVIYSNRPLELAQLSEKGLWPNGQGGMSTSDFVKVRNNLSLWIVTPEQFLLTGFQPDTTSPLDSEPAKMRQIYFNEDLANIRPQDWSLGYPIPAAGYQNGYLPGLKLTVLTAEHVLANPPTIGSGAGFDGSTAALLQSSAALHTDDPRLLTLDYAEFRSEFRASGTDLRFIHLHSQNTDWRRRTEDSFRYGSRDFNVNRMALIGTANGSPYEYSILPRGQFQAWDFQANMNIFLQCQLAPPFSDAIAAQMNAKFSACEAACDGGGCNCGGGFCPQDCIDAKVLSNKWVRNYADRSPMKQTNEFLPGELLANSYDPIPPNNRFYKNPGVGTAEVEMPGFPYVFKVQQVAASLSTLPNTMRFQGLRLMVNFDTYVPPGRKDLSAQRNYVWISHAEGWLGIFRNRRIHLDNTTWIYKPSHTRQIAGLGTQIGSAGDDTIRYGIPCDLANLLDNSQVPATSNFSPSRVNTIAVANTGLQKTFRNMWALSSAFQHSVPERKGAPPEEDFRNLGSLQARPQPSAVGKGWE